MYLIPNPIIESQVSSEIIISMYSDMSLSDLVVAFQKLKFIDELDAEPVQIQEFYGAQNFDEPWPITKKTCFTKTSSRKTKARKVESEVGMAYADVEKCPEHAAVVTNRKQALVAAFHANLLAKSKAAGTKKKANSTSSSSSSSSNSS